MEQFKKTKGVTMIALVVTIVVMLIIASILVATFSGKSGMIDKANDSKIYTELKQLQDELRKYKAQGEGERLKNGDYSGEMSNDDLAKEGIGIIREFKLKELNRTVGLVNLSQLSKLSKTNINSTLGNNESTYQFSENENDVIDDNGIKVDLSKEWLTDFTDVFAIDVFDNTLFYVLNGEIWKLDGETGNVEKVAENDLKRDDIVEAEGPVISVAPNQCEKEESVDVKISVQSSVQSSGIDLSNSNEYQYYFSTDKTDLIGGSWKEYKAGESINLSGDKGEEYYLFVKKICDEENNYSQKNGEMIKINGSEYHRFGPYTFIANNTDSDITFSYKIDEIDATTDEIDDIKDGKWFNKKVTVNINWGKDLENKELYINDEITEVKDKIQVTSGEQTIKAKATVTDTRENKTETVTLRVDQSEPIISFTDAKVPIYDDENTTIEATIEIKDEGGSGLDSNNMTYGWSNSLNTEPETWQTIENTNTDILYEVNKAQSYYLWVKAQDNAENNATTTDTSCTVKDGYVIKEFEVPEAVAKVVIGDTQISYGTIQEAIDACPKDGTEAKIYLKKSTEETSTTYEGQNIILDLCGNTINNNDLNIATITNNAILNIINSTKDEDGIGKITSTNGIAIKNNENSTLTLGENDDTVSSTNPEIIGKVNGILNNGTFSFYDGIIKVSEAGNKAVYGKITNTSDLYSAITTEVDGKENTFLGRLASYAARIDNIYYSTLQDAVNDAKQNDEIYLLNPCSLLEPLVIDSSKDIILNLDGNNINSIASSDYLIKNYGKLKIISRDDNYGEDIESVQCTANGIVETGVNLSGNYRIETSVIFDSYTNTYNNIWGTGSSKFESWSPKSGQTLCYRLNGTKMESTNVFVAGTTYNIVEEYKDGVATATVNGEEWINKSITSNTSSDTVKLFASTSNTCTTYMTSYYFKIYKEDELVLDLIPVKSGDEKDGQIAEQTGFYDNVSKTFKYSSGTEYGAIYTGKIKQASIISSVDNVIYNDTNANLIINDINVTGEKDGTSNEYKNVIENLGNLNLENGVQIQPTGKYNNGIYNVGILKNNGAVIQKRANGVANSIYNDGDFENISGKLESDLINNSGKVTITGGTIYRITNNSNEDLVIKGGRISTRSTSKVAAKVIVKAGTITGLTLSAGELEVSGGTINNTTGSGTVSAIAGTAEKITISGGTIQDISAKVNAFNITGGTINKIASNAQSSNLEITGGTIKNGITIKYADATVQLGNDDGTISAEQPEILAGGITTNGATFNFYDGKITGNPAITGEITQIPENAELNYETASSKETVTLKQSEGAVAKITIDGSDVLFNKIQDAIDEYNGEEGGIILLRDYNSQETITINETKNIILNLNGKNIVGLRDNFITNNGTLEIMDSTNQGIIISKVGTIINNNKDLIINSGILSLNLEGSSSLYNIGILNKGNLTINGGTIKSTKNYTTVIKNESTGTVELLTGTIQVANVSYCNGIKNLGLAQIKGGNIKSTSTSTTNYGTGIKNSGELNIIDGELIKLSTGIDSISGGTTNINGGTIQCSYGVKNNNGEVNFNEGKIIASRGIEEASETAGIININGGTIETTGYAINAVTSTSTINITNGEINVTGSIGINLQNGKVDLNISGGTILVNNNGSKVCGIYMYAVNTIQKQDVQITGGKIKAELINSTNTKYNSYGICISSYQNKVYNQTLTIGEKDGSVSKTIPEIVGTTNGVYNSNGTTFNFYDGIIKGTSAIEGTVTEWEENYEIIKTVENDIESAYLDCDLAVAKVGEQTYSTLEEAVFACIDNQETTVELLRSMDSDTGKEIAENKDIILDLKGYIVTFSSEKGIINNGKLKIIDSVGEGALRNTAGTIIENNKDLIINSGTLSLEVAGTNSNTYIDGIVNKANLTIEGGTIKSIKNYTNVMKNESTGTVELLTGTIQLANVDYCNGIENSGLVQIKGGNIQSTSTTTKNYGTGIKNSGELNIIEGELSKLLTGIDSISGGTTNINGGTIQCYYGVKNNDGEVNFNGGKITANRGILEASETAGTININGGLIETTGYGIDTDNSISTINITNGEINTTSTRGINLFNCKVDLNISGGTILVNNNSSKVCGIYMYSSFRQNVQITGGEINAQVIDSTNANYNSYGIYISTYQNKVYNQTVTIGTQDGNVNITNPSIYGQTYGIYNQNNSTLNIYDGVISGERAIEGKISNMEPQYDIYIEKENQIEKAYLSNQMAVAEVNGQNYMTLEEAFANVEDNTKTTIKILRKITVDESKSSITIGENKNIILDLNGNTVNLDNENSIINSGVLEIVDTVGDGIIKTHTGNVIVNNNELKISSGTISIEVEGNGTTTLINGIVNNSNMRLDGGTVQSKYESVNIIKNEDTGIMTMTDGNIDSLASINNNSNKNPISGIYNLGEVNLLGGNINNTYIGVNNLQAGKVTLNGVTMDINGSDGSKDGYGIKNNNGEVYIKDGTLIKAGYGIYDISTTKGTINIEDGEIGTGTETGINLTKIADVNITNGTITGTNYGISISGSGSSVTMVDGTINSSGSNAVYIAGNSSGDITFKMTGGSINTNNNYNAYGINVYSQATNAVQNIEITGGTINAQTTSTSSNWKAYGIYMHTYNQGDYKQTLTIGTQGNGISTTNPSISGDTYGIYNESGAVFNFYDGILKGKTLAMSGKVTKIENKYTIVGGTEEEYQTASLGLLATDTVTAFVNGIYYNTIQAAISSCTDNEKSYVIMSNGTVLDSDITIGENQDIVLDLNGYTISGSVSIINNGTLTIIDTSEGKTGSLTVNISGSGTVTTEN